MGAVQRTIAPATAAFRNYVSNPVESATGLPSEALESALQLGVPGRKGAGSPLASALSVRSPKTLAELDAATAPSRGNPLSLPGTLARPSFVDMGELERALSPEPSSFPEAVSGAPEAPVATPREGAGVSLLPPETPHAVPEGGYLRSVGAAGAQADPLAGYSPEAIERARGLLAENGLDNPHALEQALEDQSQHHMLGELAPGLESKLGGIAAADTGQARNTIIQSLGQRAREAPQRIEAALRSRVRRTAECCRAAAIDRSRAEEGVHAAVAGFHPDGSISDACVARPHAAS